MAEDKAPEGEEGSEKGKKEEGEEKTNKHNTVCQVRGWTR